MFLVVKFQIMHIRFFFSDNSLLGKIVPTVFKLVKQMCVYTKKNHIAELMNSKNRFSLYLLHTKTKARPSSHCSKNYQTPLMYLWHQKNK